jgi:hypothetical protein
MMGQPDDARALSQYTGVLLCVECRRATVRFERGWRAYLGLGEARQLEPIQVFVYCPECAEREFGTL